jgi:hypothetical protein
MGKDARDKKAKSSGKKKVKNKDGSSEVVVMRSDDLREIVTETVTKLMAEDVLDMDEDGIIDLKKDVELKKKRKKKDTQN